MQSKAIAQQIYPINTGTVSHRTVVGTKYGPLQNIMMELDRFTLL